MAAVEAAHGRPFWEAVAALHARRAGLKPITLYKRIRRHGLVERVITDPLDAAQSARNRSKRVCA